MYSFIHAILSRVAKLVLDDSAIEKPDKMCFCIFQSTIEFITIIPLLFKYFLFNHIFIMLYMNMMINHSLIYQYLYDFIVFLVLRKRWVENDPVSILSIIIIMYLMFSINIQCFIIANSLRTPHQHTPYPYIFIIWISCWYNLFIRWKIFVCLKNIYSKSALNTSQLIY